MAEKFDTNKFAMMAVGAVPLIVGMVIVAFAVMFKYASDGNEFAIGSVFLVFGVGAILLGFGAAGMVALGVFYVVFRANAKENLMIQEQQAKLNLLTTRSMDQLGRFQQRLPQPQQNTMTQFLPLDDSFLDGVE